MLFAKRNAEGRIDSLHRDQIHGSEPMLSDHPEVLTFLGVESSEKYQFSSMDARLVRVLEDLVDTLIERNVIRLTDLPEDALAVLRGAEHPDPGVAAARQVDRKSVV